VTADQSIYYRKIVGTRSGSARPLFGLRRSVLACRAGAGVNNA
jgi:hypothetical protein